MRRLTLLALLFVFWAATVLTAAAADNATITGSDVLMRWGPSTDAEIITTLNKGARIEVVSRTGVSNTIKGDFAYWYNVTYGNQSGYVFGRFIAIDAEAAPHFEPVTLSGGPSFPFEDWGACPMECCAYREWTVKKETIVRADRYETSPVAFIVKPGESVTGLTGVVIVTVPGRGEVTTSMKLGDRQAKPGDLVEFLTYQGEGFYKAWFAGQMLDGIEGYGAIVMKVEPVWIWWAEIKNKNGQVGWTNQMRNFDRIYSCGD